MLHFELAVLGDWVVERDDGGNLLFDLQDPVAKTLVVVDEIEFRRARKQIALGPRTECHRLGKDAGEVLRHLEQVVTVLDLPEARNTTGVVVVEGVEAGKLGQRNPFVEHGVRLPAEDFDRVSEVRQRLRQVAGVDALPADVGLAAIGQICELQGLTGVQEPVVSRR